MAKIAVLFLLASLAKAAQTHGHSGRDSQPQFAYDSSTTKLCTFWYDNIDNSIACQDVPNFWGITNEQWLRWVRLNHRQ